MWKISAFALAGILCARLVEAADLSGWKTAIQAEPTPTNTANYDSGDFAELRIGGSAFLKGEVPFQEGGGFINGQIIFAPLWQDFDSPLLDALFRPRPHLGATLSVGHGTDQLFSGLTWTFAAPGPFFVEASFGGTIHNGDIHTKRGESGLQLGCRVLFRESLGLGVDLGRRWRLLAGVDHSSHAGICDRENDGLSHVGGSVGYRF